MRSSFKKLASVAAALALCASPTMAATAAPAAMNPLVAVSIFGTQASAQTVCASATGAAAAAGAEVAAQGEANCVLPAVDAPPPPPTAEVPPARVSGFGISPVLLGLVGIAALAALIASQNDDSDSPASPS